METEKKTTQEIFARMAALCSRSEQCSTDIHKKITAAGLSSEEADEIIEKLKAENQMEWVRQMNACKAQAEEVVKAGLIYD